VSTQISFVFHSSVTEQIVEPNLRNIGDGIAFIGDLREQLRRPDFKTNVNVNSVLLFVNTDVAHSQHHRSSCTSSNAYKNLESRNPAGEPIVPHTGRFVTYG